LSYNDNGQLINREKFTSGGGAAIETTEYEWNDQGMLVKVKLPSGEPVDHKYDGTQRLVGRKDSENDDYFVQVGWDIMTKLEKIHEMTPTNGTSRNFTDEKRTCYTGMSQKEIGGCRFDPAARMPPVPDLSNDDYGK